MLLYVLTDEGKCINLIICTYRTERLDNNLTIEFANTNHSGIYECNGDVQHITVLDPSKYIIR